MKPTKVYELALDIALSRSRKDYPWVSFERGYTGILSTESKERLKSLAREDIENGASEFRKIISRARVLERELMSAKFEPDLEKMRDLFDKLVEFLKLKFIVRDVYGEAAGEFLRKVFGEDSPVLDPVRPDIMSELQTDPEFLARAWRVFPLPDTIQPISRVVQERYVKKYEEIKKIMDKGYPPEVIIVYLSYLYVYEEAVAFAHREDVPAFYADRVLWRAVNYFGIRPIDLWRGDNEG